MVGDLKGKVVLLLIVLPLLYAPAFGQTTAVDWDNHAIELVHRQVRRGHTGLQQGHRDKSTDKIAWDNKGDTLKAIGRTKEANAA